MATRAADVFPHQFWGTWARERAIHIVAYASLASTTAVAALMVTGVFIPVELLRVTLIILFGVTMKVADLTVDDGLRLFPNASTVFGIAFGLNGSLLILADPRLVNLMAPLVLACFCRRKVDRANHGLAAAMMLFCILVGDQIIHVVRCLLSETNYYYTDLRVIRPQLNIFGLFLVVLSVFGHIDDRFEDRITKRWRGILYDATILRYTGFPLIIAWITGRWEYFVCSMTFTIFYNLTFLAAGGPIRRGWESFPRIGKSLFALNLAVCLLAAGAFVYKGAASYSPEYLGTAWDLVPGAHYRVHGAERLDENTVMLILQEGATDDSRKSFTATKPAMRIALPDPERDDPDVVFHITSNIEHYKLITGGVIDNWMRGHEWVTVYESQLDGLKDMRSVIFVEWFTPSYNDPFGDWARAEIAKIEAGRAASRNQAP